MAEAWAFRVGAWGVSGLKAGSHQAHLTRGFKVSKMTRWFEESHDIVGLYLDRRSARWCCAFGPKSSKFKHFDRTSRDCAQKGGAPRLPMIYKAPRYEHALFAALDVEVGQWSSAMPAAPPGKEFLRFFLRALDRAVLKATRDVQFVLDN